MPETSINRIADLVRCECSSDSNPFGYAFFEQHIIPVVRYAEALCPHLNANPQVVKLAGYLHDLAAVRDINTLPVHHIEGARLARELLESYKWNPEVIDAVCRCIESHSAPVALGNGSAEEVALSNADVMAQIARPAYWFFYLYRVRGLEYEEAIEWLRARTEKSWAELTEAARIIGAPARYAAVRLLDSAAGCDFPPMPADYDDV